MKVSLAVLVVSLTALHGAGAFVAPVAISKQHKTTTSLFAVSRLLGSVVRKNLPEPIPGIHLPDNEPVSERLSEIISLNLPSNLETGSYIIRSSQNNKIVGTNKLKPPGSLKTARDLVMTTAKLEKTVPSPSTYKFFGSEDNRAKELATILKTNPFMAMALTKTSDGFELKSFDPSDKNPSRYLLYMRTLNGVGHRVNFQFDKEMNVKAFQVYADMEAAQIQADNLDVNKYASSALFNLLFFASSIHATMHVLHFLLADAFDVTADAFRAAQAFADTYEKNINIKYIEVGTLLLKDPPSNPDALDLAIISGKDGFGSSQAIRGMLKDLLNEWGTKPTAQEFFDTMYNLSREEMEEAGILEEFFKHFDLVKPFSSAAADALKSIDAKKFADMERKLKEFLPKCGDFQSNIDTFSDWLELMSITGIVHGATLSYTRLIGTESVARWRNFMDDDWDTADINLITGGLGTITGMDPGRHVMSSTTGGWFGYNEKLEAVLKEYDDKTTKLKEEYEAQLVKSPDFKDLGFILSDFCPDDFDGKQLTIATYI